MIASLHGVSSMNLVMLIVDVKAIHSSQMLECDETNRLANVFVKTVWIVFNVCFIETHS